MFGKLPFKNYIKSLALTVLTLVPRKLKSLSVSFYAYYCRKMKVYSHIFLCSSQQIQLVIRFANIWILYPCFVCECRNRRLLPVLIARSRQTQWQEETHPEILETNNPGINMEFMNVFNMLKLETLELSHIIKGQPQSET